jgi:hypothetical protein
LAVGMVTTLSAGRKLPKTATPAYFSQ